MTLIFKFYDTLSRRTSFTFNTSLFLSFIYNAVQYGYLNEMMVKMPCACRYYLPAIYLKQFNVTFE